MSPRCNSFPAASFGANRDLEGCRCTSCLCWRVVCSVLMIDERGGFPDGTRLFRWPRVKDVHSSPPPTPSYSTTLFSLSPPPLSLFFHPLLLILSPPPGVGDHSYCRNPDSSERPWCYISGPDGLVQRQFCNIQTCQGWSSVCPAKGSYSGGRMF